MGDIESWTDPWGDIVDAFEDVAAYEKKRVSIEFENEPFHSAKVYRVGNVVRIDIMVCEDTGVDPRQMELPIYSTSSSSNLPQGMYGYMNPPWEDS